MLQTGHGTPLRAWLLASVLCALAACATTQPYERSLDAWKGSSRSSLVEAWGPPSETFDSDGHTFLVYMSSRAEPFSLMPNTVGAQADHKKSHFCTTVFDVAAGIVSSWAIKGDDCANEPMKTRTDQGS